MHTQTILNSRDLGQAFKAERLALGRTQQALATTTGYRRQTVVDLEAGRNVSIQTVFAVLAALGKGLTIVDTRPDLDQLQLLLDAPNED